MTLKDLFIKCVIAFWIIDFTHTVFSADEAAKTPHKNILFIVCDDMNTYLLGNPGRYDGKVFAPNMTALAESGVNFRQAYTASPKCQPSRASFLTGVAPWRSGLYDNGSELSEAKFIYDVASMGEHFQTNGYFVCSYGKIQHGYLPNKNPKRPFRYDEYSEKKSDDPPKGAPLSGYGREKYDDDLAKGKDKIPSEDWGAYENSFESNMDDTVKANKAIKLLEKDHEKPFFLLLGFFHPHQPFYAPRKYIDMYKDAPLPPMMNNPEDDLDDVPTPGKKLINDKFFEAINRYNEHHYLVESYLGCVTYTDVQVGRVLEALDKSRYKDNTIVVLISDHGFHLGEKAHITKGTVWECGANSLMMWRVPGVTKARQVCETPVSLLDIYPTLCNLTGIGYPDHQLDGNSLVPLLKDINTERHEPALMVQGGDEYTAHFALRYGKYRYIRYWNSEGEELYDREMDPKEWTNLVGDKNYAEALSEMRELMPRQSEVAIPAGKRLD
ncbi:MAG: sulfatase [Verrucomicrobiae bacterium]|nr:sulfatase [Verrucomicrobiae bacterium]